MDKISGPINFSEQNEILMSPGTGQAQLNDVSIQWTEEQLPTLRTARNSLDLIKKSRVLILLWASGHPQV